MDISSLPRLNLPDISRERVDVDSVGVLRIYDVLRRRWVVLTPEEWVRQHYVDLLMNRYGYSPYLMANEVGIVLNGMRRRCDTVVYDRNRAPWMIVEYKASDVKITQRTFDQIVRYNMVLRVPYLAVSNGVQHYCCRIDYGRHSYKFINDIPLRYGEQSD
ncbi:MAG: type I restriction enzyme HsdR N-terminal domain-containing protein [Muribaculaceae bacterium]|nr:type I restriction enzyme HsdR N-terminal domain-containing protein [Muribaculaceae bacterium]